MHNKHRRRPLAGTAAFLEIARTARHHDDPTRNSGNRLALLGQCLRGVIPLTRKDPAAVSVRAEWRGYRVSPQSENFVPIGLLYDATCVLLVGGRFREALSPLELSNSPAF